MIHNIEQGSDAWHQLRAKHFTASDAAAMMGASKYKSRNQLLLEKKTGRRPEVSKAQQAVFDQGHAAEAAAREVLEMELLEDITPVVMSAELEGLPLLASLDGFYCDGGMIFEHKLWNETLAENVRNGVLEPLHYWQLEQQLLVSGAKEVLFVVSDGTENKRETLVYESDPNRRAKLIAGWKQFAADLETFKPEAKQAAVVANDTEAFPLVQYRVEGTAIISNISEILPVVKDRAEAEMNRTLETDQDFADKEKLNKATKEARTKLKEAVANVQGEFVSFAEFSETAEQIDGILQKMQSHGEKQVKEAKEQKKKSIIDKAEKSVLAYIDECNDKISPLSIFRICGPLQPDYAGAMKGKRTIESLQNAVDSVVAETKITIDQAMSRIVPNQIFLKEHATEYSFLFSDVQAIINQDTEPFQAIVKSRIAEHKQAEADRLEQERERIRQEEEAKAAEKAERERQEEERRMENERKEQQRAEQKDTADEITEPEQPKVAPASSKRKPDKVSPHVAKEQTFGEEMADWAEKYGVSEEAMVSLKNILERHVLEFRSAS